MCNIEAFIGLGSNLDEPILQLSKAISALSCIKEAELTNVSGFYKIPLSEILRNRPLSTLWLGRDSVGSGRAIFSDGRNRALFGTTYKRQKWSARVIDLDLLIYGKAIINSEVLTVPHPQIENRSFVLYPLFEIAPKMVIPGLGAVEKLLSRKDVSSLVDTKFVWKREIKEFV